MRIPRAINNLIESFERLPGIGPKSAQRLTFYLLHVPQVELDKFADSIRNLKNSTKLCSICFNVDEKDPCSICEDSAREKSTICIVEQPLDVLALERGGTYHGVYHVLHGRIDPLNNIGPEEIYIGQLLNRLRKGTEGTPLRPDFAEATIGKQGYEGQVRGTKVIEVILATNPTMEGEATAMYIAKQLKTINSELKITRIGRGLPIGADLEYADSGTLERAMEGRSNY
jgi:recombination protein RecR